MYNIKLTIAIPTYNRAFKLKKCLENIFEQTNDMVEVLVSDNCSTDETKNIVLEMQKEHKKMRYYRNEENLGFDRNFLNCFEKARGDYVLLLGDDDFLLPGAVNSILNLLEKNPVFMHINTCNIYENNKMTEPRLKEETLILTDKDEVMKKMGIYITFISGLIMRNDLIKEIKNKEEYLGTYFMQSHIALKTMKNDGIYIINGFNCLAVSGNTKVSYDVYYVWIKCLYDCLIKTGIECDFKKSTMINLYKESLEDIVMYFVLFYQRTCKKASKDWNKECIWPCLEQFPALKKKYKKIVGASGIKLFIYSQLFRIKKRFCGKI